ncbi:LysR family transcriptional regulator [Nocardioides dongxiaopingii]|uniref:LysR family transcriptional regulator n=1 Tax=Nocardioides dongxiaopingii TaxID=2576036 RepID=UPI0010C768AD|nr:LysR family transcriptional regulator [Nocardioides dongxiaopingii]
MDQRAVEQFVAVAEELSVTRAARRLYAAQSTVSAGVRSLEHELGTRLFERTTRSMRLTEAGERVLPEARALLAAATRMHDVAADDDAQLRGRVRLGSFAGLDVVDLPHVVATFRAEHPLVDLVLSASPHGSTGLVDDLRRGRLDVAFSSLPDRSDPDLVSVPLVALPFVVLVPPGHRLARRRRVRLAELADEGWVDTLAGYGNRVLLDRTLGERGVRRRLVVEVAELPSVPRYVAAGVGVAVVPDVVEAPGCVRVDLVDGPAPWSVAVCTRRHDGPGAAARALVAALVGPGPARQPGPSGARDRPPATSPG